MKLTEVESERTFNLEIRESDLKDLLSIVTYYPIKDAEDYTDKANIIRHYFRDLCRDVGVTVTGRTDYVTEV